MAKISRRHLLVGIALAASVVTGASAANATRPSVQNVIAAFKRRLLRNGIPPADRAQLSEIDITNRGNGDGHVLALLACDNVARIILPSALDALGRSSDASTLRAMNPVADTPSATRAASRLRQLAASLDQSAGCEGASCNGNPLAGASRMAEAIAQACDLASRDPANDVAVAEQAAAALLLGLRIPGAHDAVISGASSVLLAMVATAR